MAAGCPSSVGFWVFREAHYPSKETFHLKLAALLRPNGSLAHIVSDNGDPPEDFVEDVRKR